MLGICLCASLAGGAAAARDAGPGFAWGDDSSRFARDGECDDPRFEGAGMAKLTIEENRGADASDCRRLFEAGTIDLVGSTAVAAEIDFGDDSGRWANDGECEDPRFEGEGMAAFLLEEDRLRDASDCRRLFEAGAIRLRSAAAPEPAPAPTMPQTAGDIDFGDDSGTWPNDGECDDPRFEGDGVASFLSEDNRLRDASDCRQLFEAGRATLRPDAAGATPAVAAPQTAGDIDFGDDSGTWPNDGECDDPRFEGDGVAGFTSEDNRLRDASDCRRLFEAGRATLRAGAASAPPAPAAPQIAGDIDFGDDSGSWPNDGECDDPRFEGDGMAVVPLEEDRLADASDCRALFEAGRIRLRP
ncbi:MAG: hypothetical protein ACFE0R_17695 [Salinarimonas sp.]